MKKPSKTYSKSRKMDFGGTLHDIGLGVADELIPTGLLTGQSASKQFGWDYDTVDGQNYQKGFQNVAKLQKGLAPVVAGAAGTAVAGPMGGAAASGLVSGSQNIYSQNQANKAAQPVFPSMPTIDNRQQLSKMAYGGIVGGRNRVMENQAYHISNSNQMGGNFNIGGFLPHTAQIGATISNVNQVTGQGAYNGVVPDEDILAHGGSIHIKPENKGKFTAYKQRTGKTTEEALHSSNAHVRQMANFSRNASHWNHKANGGDIYAQPYLGTTDLTYATGGPIANNYLQLEGDKHSAPSEGIDYTPGVKVEDKEGVWKKDDGSKYVFSEQLGFSKQFDKLKNKYSLRSNDKLSTDVLNQKLGKLEQAQEILKATNAVKDKYMQMAKGGYIKMDGFGQSTIPGSLVNIDDNPYTKPTPYFPEDASGISQDLVDDNTVTNQTNNGFPVGASKANWNPDATIPNSDGTKQDYSKYLPYLGAASQAIGDAAYYAKGYNKLKTANYQAPQFKEYNPALLNPNQALTEADLGTRTQLSQVPNYSNGNSATALNNMLAAGAQGNRNKADIRSNYDNANTQIKNSALAANTQGLNQYNLHNAGMKYQSDLGNLQDLTQMQNADIGHLSNIGAYGAQGVKDQIGYNTQAKDRAMLGQVFKDATLDKDGNVIIKGVKYKKVE